MKNYTVIAVLFLRASSGALARAVAIAPLVAAALLAVPADEARADSGHPGGNYPLHCAAGVDNNLAAVIHLLGSAHGKNVNERNADSASYRCSSRGQYGRRDTPLHHAASYGHATIVATLIVAGAEVNAKNNEDKTPLHDAARNGRVAIVAIVSMLIAAGANVNAKSSGGETPLYGAAYLGHAPVVSVLIAAGADVNAKNDGGYAPLHRVAVRSRASIVSILIAAGADVNAKANDGRTPLYLAAYEGNAPVVSILIAAGANVNVKNTRGETPLNGAAFWGHAPVVSVLIAAGADVNAKTDNGETPLYRAVIRGSVSVVSILVAAGADVNASTNRGTTPLHQAASNRYDRSSIISILIMAGADVNAKDDYGYAPLHEAASNRYDRSSIISILITAGADVNAKTDNGETPLHRAASRRHASIVSILIAAGGHWGVACVNAAVFNPAGPSPPCLCESPNVGTPENCVAPSAESCAEFHDPPRFYDADAGECGDRLYPCHDSAIRKADNSGCECPPNSYAHGDPSGGSHSHIPDTAVCHADHAPIFHDLNGWLDFIQTDNSTLILHFISDHDESPNQLAHAIQHSAHRAITILINRGANLNLANSDGDTPLHLAARKTDALENIALVSLLLDKDANPNIRNNAGWRPLDLAYHGGNSGTWQARREIMAALINGGANWSDECSGGAIPNENYRGEAQVAIYPQCRCPAHMSQRDSGGACECPAHSHSQVNGLCLPKDSAQVEGEIAKMQVELARLRAALVSLNARLSLSAEMPREMVEDIAEQARETAAEIDWRRANFVALGRRAEAGEAPPPVALSDTAAECRMRGGEVRIDSGSGTRICLGLDRSGTFCLVDSGDAFPCRGLFKHVRRCNDVYHRPALNAFICGARCGANETAQGKDCE